MLQKIVCLINVQHCCALHNCTIANTSTVRQERHNTTFTKAQVVHEDPTDLILNTARMHDAIFMHEYQFNPSNINMETSIMQGCVKEINERKQHDAETSGRGHGRGHGRSGCGHGNDDSDEIRGTGSGRIGQSLVHAND